jgi:hypothetical protein
VKEIENGDIIGTKAQGRVKRGAKGKNNQIFSRVGVYLREYLIKLWVGGLEP